jgi:hypothetical protein
MCEALGDAEHELRLAARAAEGADVLQLAAESGGAEVAAVPPDLDLEFYESSSSDGDDEDLLCDVVTPLYADWILAACAWVSAGACAAACAAPMTERLHLRSHACLLAGLSTLIQFLEGCESFRMESGVKKALLVLSLLRSVCLM